MNEEQRKAVKLIQSGLQPRAKRWHGRLGNFSGVIEVAGRAGFYWARVEKGGADFEEGIFRGNIARPLYDLPVLIETDPVTQERRIVGIDQTSIDYGIYNGNPVVPVTTERHAFTHEWRADADDQLQWLSTNQIYETRCQPGAAAMSIVVQGGPFYAGGAFRWKADASTVDLSSYWPVTTNTKWVLVTLDSSGAVVIVDNSAATLSALAGPAENHYAVAAVRLRKLQAAVSWLDDIVDVRFMPQQASTLSFLDLTDTPDSYSGAAKKIVRVDATPDALEFGANLDDLDDVNAPTPVTGYGLGFDGSEWIPYDYPTRADVEQMIRELAGGALYLHEEDADVVGYEQLLGYPANGAETVDNAVANSGSGEVVIGEYITMPSTGMGLTMIPGGAWHFVTFCYVDSAVGVSEIVIRVYKRAAGGTETELFNITTGEINNTTVASVETDTVQPDFIILTTDRLVVKYFFKTTSAVNRTGYLVYEGTSNYSHIHTTLGGGIAAISVDDTNSIDLTLSAENLLTASVRRAAGGGIDESIDGLSVNVGLDDLNDCLVDTYADGVTLVGNAAEGAFESRKLKISELSATLGPPVARTESFDFTGTTLDTVAECNAVGIRFSGSDAPFPAPNLGTISGSWSHVAGRGWKPASAVDAQGPAMLIPLPAYGPNIKIVVEFEYTPSATNHKGALHISAITRTQNVAAYTIAYDDQSGASGLTCEGQTNDGDDTYTARYTGTFYSGSAVRTYGLRWLSACPGFYDAQDGAWHDYTAKPATVPYTPEYLYIYFQKYSGFTFFDPVYIKSITLSCEV